MLRMEVLVIYKGGRLYCRTLRGGAGSLSGAEGGGCDGEYGF